MADRLIVRQGDLELSVNPAEVDYMASLGWVADKPKPEPKTASKAAPKEQ